MGAIRPWTEAENRRLIELHRQGLTQAKVCKEMVRAPATIQRKARELGLAWNGAANAGPATRTAQLEDKRAVILTKLEERAVALIGTLEADRFTDLVKGEYGSEQEATLKFLPSKSAQQMTAAIKNLTGAIKELQQLQNLHTDSSDLDMYMKHLLRVEIVNGGNATDPGTFTTGDGNAPRGTGELQEGMDRGSSEA